MKCNVCSSEVERAPFIRSGAPLDFDLEFRMCSPEVLRTWVTRCPKCGLCARELRRDFNGSSERMVSDPGYVAQLGDPDFPELANSFLCAARLFEASGDLGGSALEALHAAWACDDDGWPDAAKNCRAICLSYLDAGGVVFRDERQVLLRVELLRRSGDFEAAEKICETELSDPVYGQILSFQRSLIEKKDSCRRFLEITA